MRTFYHIMEESYPDIGYQGFEESEEEAQKSINHLQGLYPENDFWIFTSESQNEPPITTV